MHFLQTTALLIACSCLAFTSPLPSIEEIERKWAEGQTEAQIHAPHNFQAATPAWPILRPRASRADRLTFATSLDDRTRQAHGRRTLESYEMEE